MAGLLDWINTPEGQGLLAAGFGGLAGARKGAPLNSIGRAGLAGLGGYAGAQDREIQQQEAAAVRQYRDAQTAAITGKQAEEQRISNVLRDFGAPRKGMGGTGIVNAALPADLQIGAQPAMQQPGQPLDYSELIRQRVPADVVKALAESANYGRAKVARTIKGIGPDGKEYEYQTDEYGQKVGDGLAQYRAPLSVNQGDRTTFADPYSLKPIGEFRTNMSLSEKDASARGWASNSVARDRLAFDKAGGADGGKPVWIDSLGAFANPRTQQVLPARDASGNVIEGAGPKLTEDQGKATGWLVQATQAFDNMKKVGVDDKGEVTSAARPGFNDALASIPSFGFTSGLANMMRSDDRQRFMQSASTLSEALLRAATGAGVNATEAEQKIRELTPVIGDGEANIKQKMDAIPLYLKSLEVRAGNGAKKLPSIMGAAQGNEWQSAAAAELARRKAMK
jgi:hypothetical protein